jgi:hypothetical protein
MISPPVLKRIHTHSTSASNTLIQCPPPLVTHSRCRRCARAGTGSKKPLMNQSKQKVQIANGPTSSGTLASVANMELALHKPDK